jgi:hypothetical protein
MSSGTVQMWILAFSAWVLWGVLGFYVAGQRGIGRRSGYLVGLLLGPFGVTILALIPVPANIVPDIGPDVRDAQCEHCGAEQDVASDAQEFTCWRCKQVAVV